ncbi:MAG: methyltransferase domain-containing protein [Paenibacillus sp.]|nr:methyltransferase domain-containing protein [Paenibacillus sp.]
MSKYNYEVDLSKDNSATKIINLITDGSRVLEFGCASGYMTKILKEKKSCHVDCVEINEADAEIARQYCGKMLIGDVELIDFEILKTWGTYDYIVFADVLEHLKNPELVLEKCKVLLNGNGEILSSIPNVAHASIVLNLLDGKFQYQKIGLLDNTHLKLFTKKTIFDLFEGAGFLVNIVGKTEIYPEFSEFATNVSLYPKEILDYIYKYNSEANTYQFIVRSKICSEANLLKETTSKKNIMEEEILELKNYINHQKETLEMQIKYSEKIETIIENKDGDYKKLEQSYIQLLTTVENLNDANVQIKQENSSISGELLRYQNESDKLKLDLKNMQDSAEKQNELYENLINQLEYSRKEMEQQRKKRWYSKLLGRN